MFCQNFNLPFLACFVCLILTNMSDAYRILAITPMPYFSHQYFYRPVWNELADRGHEVVLITGAPMPGNHSNIHQIDVSFGTKIMPRPNYTENYIEQVEGYYELMLSLADVQMQNSEIQELLHNPDEHFDLVVIEFTMPVMFSFKKRFNTPLILLSPLDMFNFVYEKTGSPAHELLYSFFREIYEVPGFTHRVSAFLRWAYDYFHIPCYFDRIDDIGRQYFGNHTYPARQAFDEFDLVFVNVNIALQEVRPLTPAVIPMGGGMFLDASKNLTLPHDLQLFLDQSNAGVIFVSFGTYVQKHSMSNDIFLNIIKTFALVPYKILWKTDPIDDDILRIVNKTGNVYTSKWLPQPKVLEHKNVKLFITQGGIQSLEEAIILKVPSITLPILADQHPNANRMEQLHLGARLDINTVTPEILNKTIAKVLADGQMRINLEKYSWLLQDQPMQPVDRAVWWVEYIIRNKGARHLRGRTLPWWQHMYVDVISFIILTAFLLIVIVSKLLPVKELLRYIMSKKGKLD